MKAAVLEEVGRLVIKDIPEPTAPVDGLLIEVAACAVCGTDVKVWRHGHRLIRPPRVIGHELAGTIVAVGRDVTGYAVGEAVQVAPAVPCGECRYCREGAPGMCDDLTAVGYHYDGGYERLMAVPGRAVRNGCVNRVPNGVELEVAALAEPLACCINGQELSRVKLGDVVVVIGAGPIGCLHVELARAKSATTTVLVDISAERLERSSVSKPDYSVLSIERDPVEFVMEITRGRGADVVIVACSSGKAQEQGLQMVAKRGNCNLFGGLPKDNPYIRFDSNLPHYREFTVVGTHGSAPSHNRLALDLIAGGLVDAASLITHRFPLSKVTAAIETVERAEGLKVLVIPE